MAKSDLPTPTVALSRDEARRFLVAHQRLWPPQQLEGPEGIRDYVQRVGCIQYDPVNVVGQNPHLVLQARVRGYRQEMLDALLYKDRVLWDGWDKVSSIYAVSDWPYFRRHRTEMRRQHGDPASRPMTIAPQVMAAIDERGPLSSADLEHTERLTWSWGHATRLARASLEVLNAMGDLGIHHRVGTRRVFDRTERLLGRDLLAAPDPNATLEEYHDWHVLRRVGGIGLANPRATEYWLGILSAKTPERKAALRRLVDRGRLVVVAIEGTGDRTFFLRTVDLPTLEFARNGRQPAAQAALLPPLDNLLWDRDLLRHVFGFDYLWEVYKPARQRRYGYYVLPVLYDDRFVARCDPALDRKAGVLTINNWWWEEGVVPDEPMQTALAACLGRFMAFSDARTIRRGNQVAGRPDLAWVELAGDAGCSK